MKKSKLDKFEKEMTKGVAVMVFTVFFVFILYPYEIIKAIVITPVVFFKTILDEKN